MKTIFALSAAVLGAALLSQTAMAQTVYEGVRYQYGVYNEVFYGGTSPALTSNNYGYMPSNLQNAYTAYRYSAPIAPYSSSYTPYGPNTTYYSPFAISSTGHQPYNPYLYTDYLPGVEVGQAGYTISDARNEAYNNVPRYQLGADALAQSQLQSPAPAADHTPTASHGDARLKAIPLLDWAKAEHTRNPALYKALLHEARKYDSAAVDAFEKRQSS